MTEIRRLLDQIQYNQLVMPAFQREYVWKLEQAKELLGSLYRQYPTGSLLFWETTRPPELKNIAFDLKPGTRLQVILDGQQRLTTLYLLIKDTIPPYYSQADIAEDPRHLHFNLETAEFKYHTEREMDGNPLWRRVSDLYESPPDPLEVALARVGGDNLPADIQLQRQINTNLNRLNAVLDQDYPVQMVPDAADITATVRGNWPDSCLPAYISQQHQQTSIQIRTAPSGQICLDVITPFTLPISINSLPAAPTPSPLSVPSPKPSPSPSPEPPCTYPSS